MKMVRIFLVIMVFFVWHPMPGLAQFKPGTGSIMGYMVGDYYYVATQHDEELVGRHGLWFRRIYFTYDNTLSQTIKMRLRLEMNSAGDYTSSAHLTPFVKDAYLNFKIAKQNLRVGIFEPPAFTSIEQIWGYRPLEKTPLDLHLWTSTRDYGIDLSGGTKFPYQIMLGNGSANKSENNNGKKIYGSLGYKTGGWHVEGMAQYEDRSEGANDYIIQGIGAYEGEWGRVCVQYAHRALKHQDVDSLHYNVLSVFSVYTLSEKWEFIGRFDKYFGNGYNTRFPGETIDYIPFADDTESNFFIGAANYKIHPNVWLMPNIKYVLYNTKESGEKPGSDLYLNLTLFFRY